MVVGGSLYQQMQKKEMKILSIFCKTYGKCVQILFNRFKWLCVTHYNLNFSIKNFSVRKMLWWMRLFAALRLYSQLLCEFAKSKTGSNKQHQPQRMVKAKSA